MKISKFEIFYNFLSKCQNNDAVIHFNLSVYIRKNRFDISFELILKSLARESRKGPEHSYEKGKENDWYYM